METIKINIDDVSSSPELKVIDGPKTPGGSSKSVNFGAGLDLFMNNKKVSKPGSPTSDIKLNEINDLDLNEKESTDNIKLKLDEATPVSLNKSVYDNKVKKQEEENLNKPMLGKEMSKDENKDSDGFKKFTEIPVNPNITIQPKTMKKEDELREKLKTLRKLEALEKKGFQLTKKYGMESSLDEMVGEYEMIKNDVEKKNSVKFQGKMLMAAVSGLEFLNSKFDPFDLKLDGWAEAVNENLEEYDDVFGELHDKYSSKAKMAPEIKLLFMLGGSAVMLHMTNTMFKSAMPGMDDIMKQNPDLMQQFTNAAVNSMSKNNPGFGNFVNSAMNTSYEQPRTQPPRGSPPGPPPRMKQRPPTPPIGPPSNRPDVGFSRGRPTFNDATNMDSNFASISKPKKTKTKRPEMKGPSDIGDILSGLKTKRVNMNVSDNKSTISLDDVKELKNDLSLPKKSKRSTSAKNVVNLTF